MDSKFRKDNLKERIASMTGAIGVIKVGGQSEIEINEVKDRIDDALNSTRAAIDEGVIPGGGMSLFYAGLKARDQVKTQNYDQKLGA